MNGLRSDLMDAVRQLRRSWRLTALAVGLLALTGGVTAAVYAVVHAVVVLPPLLASPERTVVIWEHDEAGATPVVEVARGEVEGWRERSTSIELAAVFTSVTESLSVLEAGGRTRLEATWVSAPFFDIAGISPALGRPLRSDDEAGIGPRAMVISHDFWSSRFAGDRTIVGRTVRVQRREGTPADLIEIVGVMPEGFGFPPGTDAWVPAAPLLRTMVREPGDEAWYLDHFKMFLGLARLRASVPLDTADRELDATVQQLAGSGSAPAGVVITQVTDYLLGPVQPALWILLAGGVLMVLLACSSVGGLRLFRAAAEDRATAVRLALGASRWQLVRQSLLESTLIGALGAAGALAIAWGLTQVLVAAAPLDVPRLAATDAWSLPVILAVTCGGTLASILTGLWPALLVSRLRPSPVLVAGARAALHPRERRIQRAVVGIQVAVAVVLLSAAGLMVRSVRQLDRTPLGFVPRGLAAVELEPSAATLPQWDRFYEEMAARVDALPDVSNVAAVARRPLSGPIGNDTRPVLKGQEGLGPDAAWRRNPRANLQSVTPGYFRTAGTTVIAGRDFTEADVAASPNVVIVGAATAARFWPGADPLGQLMVVPTQREPGSREELRWQTVVGVVDDVRYRGIRDPRLDVYLPAAQSTLRVRQLMVRGSGDAGSIVAAVRRLAHEVDPGVIVGESVSLEQVVTSQTAPWRFAMRVLVGFGATAAIVASLGLVALVSLAVTLRRKELGIRASLGASPGRLRRHVLRDTLSVAGIAAGVGLLAAWAAGPLMSSFLVDVPPADPYALLAAAATTLALGVAGCLMPAARAGRTNPADILRD